MSEVTVYAETSDARVSSSSTVYADARSGSGLALFNAEVGSVFGQRFSTPNYRESQDFLPFDTSGIPDDATIVSVVPSFYLTEINSGTSWVAELRTRAFAIPVTTADFVPGASLSAETLVATLASGSMTLNAYNAFTDVALAAAINKTGITKLFLSSDRQRTNNAPTGDTEQTKTASADDTDQAHRPKLVITYSVPVTATHGADLIALATFDKTHGADLIVVDPNETPNAPTLVDFPFGTTFGGDTWKWAHNDPDLDLQASWALKRTTGLTAQSVIDIIHGADLNARGLDIIHAADLIVRPTDKYHGADFIARATLSRSHTADLIAASLQTVGPTLGAQAVRDASGPGLVSVFAGVPGTAFTQLNPAATQATNQASIDADTTGKVWGPAGNYRCTTRYRLKGNTEYRFATGPLRTSVDTAIIKGSAIVSASGAGSAWTQGNPVLGDADKWFATGQTQDFTAFAPAASEYVTNAVAGTELEDFYKNGIPLLAVTSKAAVSGTTDKKFMDRATDTVWIGFNPAAFTMEKLAAWFADGIVQITASATPTADITIKGGIVEHAGGYCVFVGSPGDINAEDNVVIEDMEMRYSHQHCLGGYGTGEFAQKDNYAYAGHITGFELRRCYLHHGGYYNLVLTNMTSPVIEYCETAYGNDLHHGNRAVGADSEGGSKLLFLSNLYWGHNWSHDHDGDEWMDTGCGGVWEEFVIEDCHRQGFWSEANDQVEGLIVRNFLLRNNGTPHPVWGTWGGSNGLESGNLYISCSTLGEVHHGIFETTDATVPSFNADIRFSWQSGRPDLKNWYIHDNRFNRSTMAGEALFSSRASASDYSLTTSNNKWDFNEYHVPVGQVGALWFFHPSGAFKTWTQWRAGGTTPNAPASHYDPNSTITADL